MNSKLKEKKERHYTLHLQRCKLVEDFEFINTI